MSKSLGNKYGQKIFNSAKRSTTDAIKTAWNKAIQKTAEVTGDLIGNKIADKITSVPKKTNNNNNNNNSVLFKLKRNNRPTGNKDIKDTIMMLLEHLSTFRRTLEMPLLNCENNLILTCSANYFIAAGTAVN